MGENGMSVRINEARQHHPAAAVDLPDLPAILLQPGIAQSVFGFANRDDFAAEAEN